MLFISLLYEMKSNLSRLLFDIFFGKYNACTKIVKNFQMIVLEGIAMFSKKKWIQNMYQLI